MNNFSASQWLELLQTLSRAVLARSLSETEDGNRPQFSPATHAAGIIGFPGASEAQIEVAEARLGVRFPPSYRTFLSVSNGWPEMWSSVEPGQLWPTHKIAWARDQSPWLIEILTEHGDEISREEHVRLRDTESGFEPYRKGCVANLLSISERGDACELMLCPDVTDPNGDWECWKDSSWGGTQRFANLQAWFRSEIEWFSGRWDV